MPTKRKPTGKYITDKNTDYEFAFFINPDKFDQKQKEEFDRQFNDKINNLRPNLDSRILTEKSASKDQGMEEHRSASSHRKNDVDFDYGNSEDHRSVNFSGSERSHHQDEMGDRNYYQQKIEPEPPMQNYSMPPLPLPNSYPIEKQFYGEKIDVPEAVVPETPEKRRARAREALGNLLHLRDKYGVKLSREYTIYDDPDEMEAEYKDHKNRRNRDNQVKWYKGILLNIVFGVEFLNEKYNPFEFKLKDWSKQVATDMDDYTEILEEIYEKYKDKGGKMAPEIKLLFMIIMSAVTFHLSQTLFGQSGLGSTVQSNPNLINKLLGGFMKGNLMGGKDTEPEEAREVPSNSSQLLATIKKHRQKSEKKSESATENHTESATKTNDDLAMERERRLEAEKKLAEMQAEMNNILNKRDDFYQAQITELRNQIMNAQELANRAHLNSISQNNQLSVPTPSVPIPKPPNNNYQPYRDIPNNILSDASRKPRFQENPIFYNNNQYDKLAHVDDELDKIFESEEKSSSFDDLSSAKKYTRFDNKSKQNSTKKKQNDYEQTLETLTENTEEIDSIITPNKNYSGNNSRKTNSATKSANRSATKTATKSASRNTGRRRTTERKSDSKNSDIIVL